ncbi:MAG: GNAT family N-acetyltransferase [Ardenticatenaceae bacterium]|nr:GNAT family N-acetyltransferase [Ardenticatenaceae bacterium]
MSDLIIRSAAEADYAELQGLLRQLGHELAVSSVAENVQQIRARGGEVFVAERNGRLVGCVAAIIDVRLAGGICGEIVSLVVTEAERGQGIGRKLVRQAEQWFGQTMPTIRVRTNSIREAAHRFYETDGYQLEKSQRVYKKRL